MQILEERDHHLAIAWIRTCIIIHTLIGQIESGQEDVEFEEELIQEGIDEVSSASESDDGHEPRAARRENAGQRKRRHLKADLVASGVMGNNQ
jgi:hypothetical protein